MARKHTMSKTKMISTIEKITNFIESCDHAHSNKEKHILLENVNTTIRQYITFILVGTERERRPIYVDAPDLRHGSVSSSC